MECQEVALSLGGKANSVVIVSHSLPRPHHFTRLHTHALLSERVRPRPPLSRPRPPPLHTHALLSERARFAEYHALPVPLVVVNCPGRERGRPRTGALRRRALVFTSRGQDREWATDIQVFFLTLFSPADYMPDPT